jgi:hypothetical protein
LGLGLSGAGAGVKSNLVERGLKMVGQGSWGDFLLNTADGVFTFTFARAFVYDVWIIMSHSSNDK